MENVYEHYLHLMGLEIRYRHSGCLYKNSLANYLMVTSLQIPFP